MNFHLDTINGIKIVNVEQVFSPLHTEEVPKVFRHAAKLTLEDGTVLYGCTFEGCTFTSTAPQGVNAHFHVHRGVPSKRWGEVGEWTVQELFETVLDFENETARLIRQRDEARERSVRYRTEVTSLQTKLERREREINQLKARIQTFQENWAANRAKKTAVPVDNRLEQMEQALAALMAQVNSLSNGNTVETV